MIQQRTETGQALLNYTRPYAADKEDGSIGRDNDATVGRYIRIPLLL